MKIYFAGSIRGGGSDSKLYKQIILHLKKYGTVIGGEHADKKILSTTDDKSVNDQFIYNRDRKRLDEADVLVAEVTTPSLGVGYEIGVSVKSKKRVLCLFRQINGKKLSAMIAGSPDITIDEYKNLDEAKKKIDEFFK